MNVGFLMPQFGDLARPEVLRHFGALAEDLGYESIWAADHIVTPATITSPYPYNALHTYPLLPEMAVLEPFVPLGFLAACTTTVKLGFSVLILGYRHPLDTAKMIAALDVLSGGRVVIGAGVGWMREEFDALGVPFDERGSRGDETLEVWRQAWTQDLVDFEGRHFTIRETACRPFPAQRPHPPIEIGGHSRAAYRRMLRHGAAGFQAVLDTAEDSYGVAGSLAADLDVLRSMAEEAGRDPATISITGVFITTTAEQFLAQLDTYRALGMTRAVLDFVGGAGTVEGMEQTLRTIAAGVGGSLRSA